MKMKSSLLFLATVVTGAGTCALACSSGGGAPKNLSQGLSITKHAKIGRLHKKMATLTLETPIESSDVAADIVAAQRRCVGMSVS